jgi:capsular polysaccharide biosynthesis protein
MAAAAAIGSLTAVEKAADIGGLPDPREVRNRIRADPVRDTPFVRVRARARTPEGARSLAAAVTRVFVASASEQIVARRRSVEQRLEAVNAQLADVRQMLRVSRETLTRLQERARPSSEQDGFIRAFSLNSLSVSEALYSTLLAAQKDLTTELLTLRPPQLLEEPTLPQTAASPNPVLNAAIAFLLGLAGAVAVVLARESLRPARQITPSPQA